MLLVACGPTITPAADQGRIIEGARDQNERAYRSALDARGLVPAPPPGAQQVFHDHEIDARRVGEVVETHGQRFVLAGFFDEAAGTAPDVLFARDRSNALWLVDRQGDPITWDTIVVGGCWSGWTKGTTPGRMVVMYALPPDAQIAGVVRITHPMRVVDRHYKDGMCSRGGPAVP